MTKAMRRAIPILAMALATIAAQAQTYTVLHTFTNYQDGVYPQAGLILDGNTLYGTTWQGGSDGHGTVFKINTDGGGYTVLKNFTNSDGMNPSARLALSGNVLYGTTYFGGSAGYGTIFKVNTDGTDFFKLKDFPAVVNFTNSDGATPWAGLLLSGNVLYGTTGQGGSLGEGTVFKQNTDGSSYTVLKDFPATGLPGTNSDGASPRAVLVLSGDTLYGTTYSGGGSGGGTVFRVNTNGTDFTVLKNLIYTEGHQSYAGLLLNGDTLYGTTSTGGSSNLGTVFKVSTNGNDFTVLKHFSGSDGSSPMAGLVLGGSALYGTTSVGGNSDSGTVFKVYTDGSGYRVLKSFSALSPPSYGTNSDGAVPWQADLVWSEGTLYGTAVRGGNRGSGVVFKLDLSPRLVWQWADTEVVLSWTNVDYQLQSAPEVAGIFTNIPGATSPYTNPVTGGRQFFRLISD